MASPRTKVAKASAKKAGKKVLKRKLEGVEAYRVGKAGAAKQLASKKKKKVIKKKRKK